jgi:hypothetical protein
LTSFSSSAPEFDPVIPRSHQRELVATEPSLPTEFDRYADYEADRYTVICDREDPNAWIKSTETTALDP